MKKICVGDIIVVRDQCRLGLFSEDIFEFKIYRAMTFLESHDTAVVLQVKLPVAGIIKVLANGKIFYAYESQVQYARS